MRHEKKAWPEFFQEVLDGKKTFDLRIADEVYQEGDILILKEYDPQTKEYTGRNIEKTITYVLKTKDLAFWPKEEVEKYGYQVLALQ